MIIECSRETSVRDIFDDLIFSSKFVSRAYDILQRPGINPEETEKLSREFTDKLKRIPGLMNAITAGQPAAVREIFSERFFLMDTESMTSLMSFLRELSWVKNYVLDKGSMP